MEDAAYLGTDVPKPGQGFDTHRPNKEIPPGSRGSNRYYRDVKRFSELGSGFGDNHTRLADILSTFWTGGAYEPSDKPEAVLTSYVFRLSHSGTPPLASQSTDVPTSSGAKWVLDLPPTNFESCKALSVRKPSLRSNTPGEILFLRGHASPEWIGIIGNQYEVDPEFFARVLNFRPYDDPSHNFSTPGLSINNLDIVSIPLMTVGKQDPQKRNLSRQEMKIIRDQAAQRLHAYHARMSGADFFSVPVGNSYARDFYVLDESYFAIEQQISICIKPASAERGWTVLVWSDRGNTDLENGLLPGPWSNHSSFQSIAVSTARYTFPVIAYTANNGLHSRKFSQEKRSTHDIHVDYGRCLRQGLMAQNAFYALHEVFLHSACSENQFLNAVSYKLESCIAHARTLDTDSVSDLNYYKDLLYHHQQLNMRVAASIKGLDHFNTWPETVGVGERHRNNVMSHFQELVERAETLSHRCDNALTVLMQSMSIEETRAGLIQGKRLAKLTILATVFVPLSFSTSLFGMNVQELGVRGAPPLWYWSFVAVPITLLPLAIVLVERRKLAQMLMRLIEKLKEYLL